MLGIQTKLTATVQRLEKATKKGSLKSLRHAGFAVRKSSIASMVFTRGPSAPGTPPHAHTGRLRRSIRLAEEQDGDGVFVGPSYNAIKAGGRPVWLAEMLEHGGTFTGKIKTKQRGRPKKGEEPRKTRTTTFPARPFMQPALKRNLARFHREWEGAIS